METQELRGEPLAARVRAEVRAAADAFRAKGVAPRLAAVVTESDPGVMGYAELKARAASALGVTFDLVLLPAGAGQEKLEATLDELGANPAIHGIVLELPLARGLDTGRALDRIPPVKDVDGLTPRNLGLLYMNREREALVAATAQACVALAESVLPLAGVRSLAGVRVGVVGKGRTVGAPLIGLLLNRGAVPVVCHSRTPDLGAALRDCDVVFAAAGKPGLLGRRELREGQVVIDAGTTIVDGRLRGDVDAASARGLVRALSPVPAGVGPLTTAIIFRNLIQAVRMQGA